MLNGTPKNISHDLWYNWQLNLLLEIKNCEKFIDITSIENNMKMIKKINGDSTCHFEIWEK